jgi:fluoride exporter
MEWQKVLWIGFAGSLGALARYWLGGLAQKLGTGFPWSTLVVNGLGCLLFGVVWSLAEQRGLISTELRTILLVGFMGAFTTFSTFAFETEAFMRDGQYGLVAANVAAQLALGLVAMIAGQALGRLL